jgi:hypothetical protein
MNPFIARFKACAHQAGEVCSFTNGVLVREFGLGDFLDGKLTDTDGAPDIAIKALGFFCEEYNPHDRKFRFGVLSVGLFLQEYGGDASLDIEDIQQPLQDLVRMLKSSPKESQLRKWIESNFGPE